MRMTTACHSGPRALTMYLRPFSQKGSFSEDTSSTIFEYGTGTSCLPMCRKCCSTSGLFLGPIISGLRWKTLCAAISTETVTTLSQSIRY